MGTTAFAEFDLSIPLQVGEELTAIQILGQASSPPSASPPLVAFAKRGIDGPTLLTPLMACSVEQVFLAAEPAAITQIRNVADGGASISFFYVNPSESFVGRPSTPLVRGTLYAQQSLTRLGIESEEIKVEVVPRAKPEAPTIAHTFCPNIELIHLSGLVPGAVVSFECSFEDRPPEIVGIAGSEYVEQDFHLDSAIVGAGTLTSLRVKQSICDVESDWSTATQRSNTPDSNLPAPHVAEPLYGCANILRIDESRPGYLVRAYDADTKVGLCDPIIATSATVILHLWSELESSGTKRVLVTQQECFHQFEVFADVHPLPEPFPMVVVSEPVRPGQRMIEVGGCLIGAWIDLFVDGIHRTRAKATGGKMTLCLPGQEVLPECDLLVRQRLCDRQADTRLRVRKGKLYARHRPDPVFPGNTVTIDAIDADLDRAVLGLPMIPGVSSGGSFLVPSTSAPASIQVIIVGEPAYNNVDTTIPVSEANPAPPPPSSSQLLGLHLRNNEFVNLPLKVTKASWSVSFDWGGSATGDGIDVSIPVPAFPQSVAFGRITVSLSIDWIANGYVGGVPVNPSSGTGLVVVSGLEVGWPDSGYSGVFSVLVDWIYRQTPTQEWVEPVIQVIKDIESIND